MATPQTPKKIKKEIIANVESLETRIAILEDGKLEDYFVERSSDERIVGSIFRGKIQNLEDGLQAAFVDIGLKKNAFIHYWDMIPEDAARLEAEEGVSSNGRGGRKKKYQAGEMQKQFPIGSEIIVQVSKAAIGTKGPRVTANLSIAGRYLVMMPGSGLKGVSRKISGDQERRRLKKILSRMKTPDNLGFIIRTAGEGARKTGFARDLRALLDIWNNIEDGIKNRKAPCQLYQEPDLLERIVRDALTEDIDRIVIDQPEEAERIKKSISRVARNAKRNIHVYDGNAPIFEHFDIERQLSNAFRRKVWLPGGGYLVFDETEALVAIDINTGRHKGGSSQEESILEVNLESADEIARQLRLRNVGGLVVIDFIDMKQRKNRQAVYRRLREAVRKDKARTNLLPISDLGLLEMTRQRAKQSIGSAANTDCPYCKGRGIVKSPLTMSVEVQRHIHEVMRKLRAENKPLNTRITVHPIVMDRLRRSDENLLVELEEKYGGHLAFVSDAHLHIEEFVISNPETHETYYSNIDQSRVHLQLE
jgi:ribonuclease G